MREKTSIPYSIEVKAVGAHDLQRINAAAEQLNSEAAEVLEYQPRSRAQMKDDAEA